MNSPPSTVSKIVALLHKLSEGDRQRVLQFVQGVVSSREGKKAKRRSRFQQSEAIDDWQVGL